MARHHTSSAARPSPRKRSYRALAFGATLILAAAVVGCAPRGGAGAPAAHANAVEQRNLAQLLHAIADADSREDLPSVLACYEPDVTWFPPDGSIVQGLEAVRERYARLFAGNDLSVTIHLESCLVRDGVAVVRGDTCVQRAPRGGGPCLAARDQFVMLTRKSGGEWRVYMLAWWPKEP